MEDLFMSDDLLPIKTLISNRCDALSLRLSDLVRRCGYKNISKGLRRLESVQQGCVKGNEALIQALPTALEVAADVVKEAVESTQRQIYEANEAAWRAAFRPHAVILTEKDRPEQIFIAAIIGVDRLLRVDLDSTEGEVTYIDQALKGIRQKLARWNSKVDVSAVGLGDLPLPTFGRPVGVIVNYTPDRAIRFDLSGRPIEFLDRAHRIGDAQFFLKGMGRPLSRDELDAFFGGNKVA
jgi:hypothetical protein